MSSALFHVIDDDPDLRASIEQILLGAGYTVEVFEEIDSWERARDEALSWPDCILVDDLMPGKKGSLYLSEMKSRCPLSHLVMVTAYGSVEHAVAAMKAGADDYLVKPFRKDELINLVRRGLEQRKLEMGTADAGQLEAVLSALANPIRRQILEQLNQHSSLRFMELTRILDIEDHTKVNFHLKQLRSAEMVEVGEDRDYRLTSLGRKSRAVLRLLEA
ncbi:MAG: response regulator [Ketobacter sp.]